MLNKRHLKIVVKKADIPAHFRLIHYYVERIVDELSANAFTYLRDSKSKADNYVTLYLYYIVLAYID